MSLWLFALGILALLLEPRPSCSITHNAQVDAYVKKLIVEFKTDPRSRRYDNVISPPRFGDGYQDFLLPKVFIWCPMHHYGLDILCPLHNLPLKAGFFTDELQRKGPRNPRLVYDLRGNVLLIQRLYICPQEGMKHKYFSASLSIIENIPKLYGLCCFPFVMFHKSSCTKQLVDFVETQILQGVNFLAICEGIAGLNFKEFSERMACFSIYQDSNSHINETKLDYDNFYSDSMYAFPGDKKVMELFLGNFVHKKSYYDAEMEKTARSSKIITCDHTFKVSKYICASRGSDNKYIKQFENLFIVLNEDHKVVGWRLTKSTAFEDIRDLLQEIKYSLDDPLKTVIVDDCCKVKRQYESIFPGIVVKLDLFHATQRVIKTFPKGSEWSKQISSEFGLVFREDGDCGATRCLKTPEPEVIERNLDNFIKKWKHTLNDNVKTKTFRELENLRIHVKNGCISGIEPGQGTECNERLHQTLNKSLLCGATKIGPEIAIAVITLIFYALNCRREGKKHEGNSRIIPFVPLPSVKAVKVAEELEEQKFRTAHLNGGSVGDDIQLDNVWRNCEIDTSVFEGLSANAIFMLENVEDMCNDTVTALLMKNTKTMLDMLNEINNQCNDRSFNAYDLPVKQSVGDDHVLASDADTNPSSEQDHNSLLIRNLSSFNLEIDPVEGDGDCAFRSIIKQMRKTLEWNDANCKLTDHLKDMDLAGAAIDDDVFTLRQLFVNNVQSNEYYQMLLGISVEELNAESERFREQGTFSGEVGDLVMKVCSDILQIPILVVTSMPRHSYVPFIPDEMVVTSTLYVAFNAFGPGHYDGTRPTTLQEQGIELSPNTKGKGCSCGKNNTDSRSSCLPGSRCPCIHKERSCDRDCRCKSCANKATLRGRITRIPADLSCRCGEDSVKSDPKFVACVDGRRRSRCPCLKAKQGCNIACACKNCGNPNGENKKSVINPVKRKRKRESASPYKRVRSADYLTSVNVEPNQKLWTVYEQCLLMTVASFLASTLVSPSVDNVVHLFNHIANSSICKESKFPIRAKNNLQIAGKLRQLEKKKNVLK